MVATGQDTGRTVVRVVAPDQLGLLWAACRWFADNDVSIEATNASTVDGVARDVFVVTGEFDADALAGYLSAKRVSRPLVRR